jgi:hypothetical protein
VPIAVKWCGIGYIIASAVATPPEHSIYKCLTSIEVLENQTGEYNAFVEPVLVSPIRSDWCDAKFLTIPLIGDSKTTLANPDVHLITSEDKKAKALP